VTQPLWQRGNRVDPGIGLCDICPRRCLCSARSGRRGRGPCPRCMMASLFSDAQSGRLCCGEQRPHCVSLGHLCRQRPRPGRVAHGAPDAAVCAHLQQRRRHRCVVLEDCPVQRRPAVLPHRVGQTTAPVSSHKTAGRDHNISALTLSCASGSAPLSSSSLVISA
jgi:hypothetical protein